MVESWFVYEKTRSRMATLRPSHQRRRCLLCIKGNHLGLLLILLSLTTDDLWSISLPIDLLASEDQRLSFVSSICLLLCIICERCLLRLIDVQYLRMFFCGFILKPVKCFSLCSTLGALKSLNRWGHCNMKYASKPPSKLWEVLSVFMLWEN